MSDLVENMHVCFCRVCWAMVRRAHWWDAMQALRCAQPDQASPDLASRVLAHLDGALHVERYTPRLAYGQLLSGFKLQLLSGFQADPSARAVCKARAGPSGHLFSNPELAAGLIHQPAAQLHTRDS